MYIRFLKFENIFVIHDSDRFKLCVKKYGIDSGNLRSIPLFNPEIVKIENDDEDFEQCITAIKRRMRTMGSPSDTNNNNEALCCSYRSHLNCECMHGHKNHRILKDDTKLRQELKEVMEVIVDLLNDRVSVGDSPASKKG
ncbi:12912_t:CDS:2 [Ambispora gerdemannii]|uniref:12912_t:CDS:1 n=1 Tax=Ambispora gerdemannii TaxID=144530 RepID=A0A9N9AY52_9GLOM|nr:12912_t:CDS:2 [Ambispora gerdemannii]